jgi:hypothetical protein
MRCKTVLITSLLLVAISLLSVPVQQVQASGEVIIVSDSSFYNSLDTLRVVGEVENTGDTATEFIKVTATFYDSSNQVIATKTGYASLDVLLPGRKSPFAVLLFEEDNSLDVHSYTLTVSWSDYEGDKPLGLEIVSYSDYVDALDFLHVTGEIKNQGSSNANSVIAITTFYDASGTVVGKEWNDVDPSDLSPNQTGTFDIELIYPEQAAKVASYTVTAESEDYALIPEFPTLIPMLAAVAVGILTVGIYKKKLRAQS